MSELTHFEVQNQTGKVVRRLRYRQLVTLQMSEEIDAQLALKFTAACFPFRLWLHGGHGDLLRSLAPRTQIC